MPAIQTNRLAGKPLDKVLHEVLNTKPNEWNYFFESYRIKEVFLQLANQIQKQNFFTSDYSINTFLDFLKAYVKEKFKSEELGVVNTNILQEFNRVCMALQSKTVGHTEGLNESQQQIVGNYLVFLHQLMGHEHRSLFDQPEIKLNGGDLQAIAKMLTANIASINEDLVEKYISLLRLSFDVPKFLVQYEIGLGIIPLAKGCFSNNAINVHIVIVRFFECLAYQGQLLDYYKNDPKFNIKDQYLAKATDSLKQKAIELQRYFFNNLNQRDDLNKALLQHYLYIHFFKVIFKKYPERIEALKTDRDLHYYIKFDYVALPNSLVCKDFPTDYRVRIEYDSLPADVPEMACAAIRCSQKTNEIWRESLELYLPKLESDYTFRVANSYKKYSMTYAYGYAPTGGGFYISKKRINQTVYGEGYSYWGNDTHNFIDVSRHEARHHDNYVLTTEADSIKPNSMGLTIKSPNEGIAVNANGPCAPGFIDRDFSHVAAPTLHNLLEESFIGYFRSWLYTNYLIQERPDFYRDSLTLDKQDFKKKWEPILISDQQHFLDWLPNLNRTCKNAPRELSLENCPSPFLKDYLAPGELKNFFITTTSQRSSRQVTRPITSRTTATIKSSNLSQAARPAFYDDYFSLMHAINAKNLTEIDRILHHTHYCVSDIVNYQNPERGLETPFHYFFGVSQKDCPYSIIETLYRFGASPYLMDDRNETAYKMAETCNNWPKIKTIFDNKIEILKKSENNETGLIPYQPKEYPLVISATIPILATINGSLSACWDLITEKFPRLENIIFYALKPVSLAMTNAIMNILFYRRLSYISSEDALVFSYYLGMNYLGMLSNQLGRKITKNIQNSYSKFFLQSLMSTFLTNPSLLGHLVYEGIETEVFSLVLWPMLSLIVSGFFFQAGEWMTKKVFGKFFIENSANSANDSKNYFVRYSLDGTPKRISEDQKTLQNIQKKLKDLTIKIKARIHEQAYKLSFEGNLVSAAENISTLIEETSKKEQNIDREIYKTVFEDFEKALANIQLNLDKLKIQLLWEAVTEILTLLRGIRLLPQVNNSPDLVANHEMRVTIEEEQCVPLMTACTNGTSKYRDNPTSHYQTPTKSGKMVTFFTAKSDFPPPPTDKELLEMENYPRDKQLHG